MRAAVQGDSRRTHGLLPPASATVLTRVLRERRRGGPSGRSLHQSKQAVYSDRWFGIPRYPRETSSQLVTNLGEVRRFTNAALAKDRVGDSAAAETLVHDPGERLDASATEILLQLRCLVDRRRFGQRDEQHLAEDRIAKAGQELADGIRHRALRARHLAVIRLGGVEQQERVTRGRGVQNDESAFAFGDGTGESTEDRDLLGAWRTEIFLQQFAPPRVER